MIAPNMHEAKSRLSELVSAAERGEEVRICRAGQAVVRLVPIKPRKAEDFLRKREGLGGIILREPGDAPLQPSDWPDAFA
jgi:prevent-host-death family protein